MNFYSKITVSLFVFFLLVLTINNRIDNRIENKIESKLTSGFVDKDYTNISTPANFNSNKILCVTCDYLNIHIFHILILIHISFELKLF